MHILKKAKDFEAGFQHAPIGMAILGADLRWISLNQEFCSLLGYMHDELWNLDYSAIIHPEEQGKMADFREHMLNGDMHTAKIETRYACKDGSIIEVEIRSALVLTEEARPNYFIDIVEDITQLKKSRMSAHETAENYRLLIENAVDHAIMRIDRNGKINSWNTGAQALFGYTEEEILGKPSSVLFSPEDVANQEDQREMRIVQALGKPGRHQRIPHLAHLVAIRHMLSMSAYGNIEVLAIVDKTDIDLRLHRYIARHIGMIGSEKPQAAVVVGTLVGHRTTDEMAMFVRSGKHADANTLYFGPEWGQTFCCNHDLHSLEAGRKSAAGGSKATQPTAQPIFWAMGYIGIGALMRIAFLGSAKGGSGFTIALCWA